MRSGLLVGVVLGSVRQLADVGGQPALAGLQDALFGFGEPGEIQLQGELVQSPFSVGKARLELTRGRAQRRDRRRPRLGSRAAGIAHEGLASDGVRGDAPGGQKGLGLTRAQAVPDDRFCQPLLLPAGTRGYGVGDGDGEATIVEVGRELGAESTAQRQAAIHPGPSPVQDLGDLRGGELIVVGEGADEADLVHGAQGTPWSVGFEQPGLAHHGAVGRVFHDHGHVGVPVLTPAGQPLEAIEDLVRPVALGRHAQGQRRQRAGPVRARSPEGRERGGQPIDGDVADADGPGAHGRASPRARIW
jgi:hypothetical protein